MGMVQEFKDFALKGSVMDLAVGVIIGGAFGKIVDSVVSDLIMPVVSRFTGGLDFSNLFIPLSALPPDMPHTLEAVSKAGIPVFAYGHFITVAINFAILAFIIFQMVKAMNRLKKATPPAPAAPAEDVILLREIRDALKAR
ncbi:MAG: mscL [Gemmatimonadetes bacterium]|jgi:large conductance mechanosensitive channel|nr:mscL [Gemmatimonadota bacterium]